MQACWPSGTSIGQVKLFDARSGKLVRSLDDEGARLADEETPDHWKPLRRALGSAQSLAFSPDGDLLAVCGGSFADFAERFDGVSRLGFRATGPGRLEGLGRRNRKTRTRPGRAQRPRDRGRLFARWPFAGQCRALAEQGRLGERRDRLESARRHGDSQPDPVDGQRRRSRHRVLAGQQAAGDRHAAVRGRLQHGRRQPRQCFLGGRPVAGHRPRLGQAVGVHA